MSDELLAVFSRSELVTVSRQSSLDRRWHSSPDGVTIHAFANTPLPLPGGQFVH